MEVSNFWLDDPVRPDHHVAHPLVGHELPDGDHEEVALQALRADAQPGLPQGEGHRDVVLLLEIAVVGGVVVVGVGAQDADGDDSGGGEGVLDVLPLLIEAAVQQDAVVFVGAVQGDQLPVLQIPGVAQGLFQFHSCVTSSIMID